MSGRIKKRFSFKRSNVKTFFFFLVFTSFLWLFTQFSKNYTKEVEVSILYKNLPEDKILNKNSDQTLKLILNGNGFRLMNHYWSKPELEFDVANASAFKDDEYHFYVDKQAASLKRELDFNGRVLSVQKDTLKLKLDINLEKKVPVKVNAKVQYTTGYGSDKGVVSLPDSIVISGPEKVVDTIQYVSTDLLELEGLNSDYKTTLSIDVEELPSRVSLDKKEIEASIQVSKFTEGNQIVPITLQNVPEGEKVTIFPKEATVVYRVGLDRYNEITAMNFKVIADYNKALEDNSFLILELIEIPESIHDVRLQEKQVQYVILK
ncbi:YbbR-like domain-containing protein [Aquimarina sp. MMG016]|uniref:YbbR-like domain-containing protein n=1 Tax=Aquimarina sp. MMG016 TaxID=2822690 RepID=UPI001B39F477|nr:YbbR-like domain-containing protein [Aquimarina sp. MMG016]MBQ4821164.1 YbbR-like domain-containing protein [Aquimarina sp. MMG016]